MKRTQIEYINGLKGIACIGIVFGHYSGIYKYAENTIPFPHILLRLFDYPLSILIDEIFWLCFFCVLSGYLVSLSYIPTLMKLFQKVIKRFLRFFIPILGANFIIYLLYLIIGFHNAETSILFSNTWFQELYLQPLTLKLVFKYAFYTILRGGSIFNTPYWMICDLFYSSLLIYTGLFFENKFFKFKWLIYLFELIIGIGLFDYIGFGCVLGAILNKLSINHKISHIKKYILISLGVFDFILIDGGHRIITSFIKNSFFNYNSYWKVIYICIILYILNSIKEFQSCLSNKLTNNLNKISFGIYSLHWPIICSISSLAMLLVGFNLASYFIIGILTIIITIIGATIYHYTIEKPATFLINKIFK